MERGEIEKSYLEQNLHPVGIDEVGRGCIAGPVFAAAVILDYGKLFALSESDRNLIRDSKKLSAKQRCEIIPVIESIALDSATASASVEEIDSQGIAKATFVAMCRALTALDPKNFQMVLVDGNQLIPELMLPRLVTQKAIIKGDHWCFAIAASSIIAKQARDCFMKDVSEAFPDYGFDRHVGYGTAEHLLKVREHGPTQWHRHSFEPIRSMVSPRNFNPDLEAR